MLRNVAIGAGMCLFALLSVADWMMTFALLRIDSTATEGNPLAAACLERYGWDGLAIYKAGATLAVLAPVWLLARRKPAAASCVLVFACGTLLAVTTYTHELIRQVRWEQREYNLAEEIPNPANRYSKSSLPTLNDCPVPTPADVERSESPRASR